MKDFLKNLLSASSREVHSPYAFALATLVLAAPVAVIAMIILTRNYLVLGRPLDSPGVQLILGLLTTATGGFGASMFAKTTTTVIGEIPQAAPPPAGPAKPAP